MGKKQEGEEEVPKKMDRTHKSRSRKWVETAEVK